MCPLPLHTLNGNFDVKWFNQTKEYEYEMVLSSPHAYYSKQMWCWCVAMWYLLVCMQEAIRLRFKGFKYSIWYTRRRKNTEWCLCSYSIHSQILAEQLHIIFRHTHTHTHVHSFVFPSFTRSRAGWLTDWLTIIYLISSLLHRSCPDNHHVRTYLYKIWWDWIHISLSMFSCITFLV